MDILIDDITWKMRLIYSSYYHSIKLIKEFRVMHVYIFSFQVSMVYFNLLNIPPELRSTLDSIQLVAVAKSEDLKDIGKY